MFIIPVNIDHLERPVCQSVKEFLKENKGKAYTLDEIVEQLNLSDEEGEFLERNMSKIMGSSGIDCSGLEGELHYYFLPHRVP